MGTGPSSLRYAKLSICLPVPSRETSWVRTMASASCLASPCSPAASSLQFCSSSCLATVSLWPSLRILPSHIVSYAKFSTYIFLCQNCTPCDQSACCFKSVDRGSRGRSRCGVTQGIQCGKEVEAHENPMPRCRIHCKATSKPGRQERMWRGGRPIVTQQTTMNSARTAPKAIDWGHQVLHGSGRSSPSLQPPESSAGLWVGQGGGVGDNDWGWYGVL